MATKNTNLLTNSNGKTIETDELVIEGHLLRWENVVLQISNISSVTAWSIQPPHFPLISTIILAIAGVVLLSMDSANSSRYSYGYYYSSSSELSIIGGVLFGIAIVSVIFWFVSYQAVKDRRYLNISTNSGITYSILFKDKDFMQEVLRVFANIFANGATTGTNYHIHVTAGTIHGNIGHVEN